MKGSLKHGLEKIFFIENSVLVWMDVPLCLFWTIWKEMNGVVFEDVVPSTQRMKNSLTFAIWSWATANTNIQAMNVFDFLDLLVTM